MNAFLLPSSSSVCWRYQPTLSLHFQLINRPPEVPQVW